MITQVMSLREATRLIPKGSIALTSVEGKYQRIHDFQPTDPMHVQCKLEFDGLYIKEVLHVSKDTLVITDG